MIQQRATPAALIALAFAAGAGIGIAVDRWLAPAPTVQARVIRDMSVVLDSLGLSSEQRAQAEAIFEASAPRTAEAMREAADRLQFVADSVDAELRAILTPEQQIRLDGLRRQPVFMIKRKTPGGGTTVDTVLRPSPSTDLATARQQLEAQYELNRQAYLKKDLDAIMALRTPDFHSVTPDSQTHDRAWMRQYIGGLLNGIERWNDLTFEIDSLELVGTEARAIVRQHADRMALRPDGKVHHVETWVTQREVWVLTPDGWKMRRVDSLRDQRRLVDGKPG